MIYPDWKMEFHVHIDASGISLCAILVQPGEGHMDHPIYFSSINISYVERNYATNEREGFSMVYDLEKF
jgi:hypothetical protein